MPSPRPPPTRSAPPRAARRAPRLAVALAALALAGLTAPASARAAEPFADWLEALGEAAERQGDGDPAGALEAAQRARAALPAGAPGARAAAAEGLALAAAARPREAVAPLRAALAGAAPEAAPALALALGEALLAAGQPAEAAAALGQAAAAAPGGLARLARRARWLEARALASAGLLPQAVAALEPLLREAPGDDEAWAGRLELAGGLRALGRSGRAFALYRALALEEPDRPEGAAALSALERWHAAGGPVPEVGGDDRLARAERLLARGRPGEALDEVRLAEAAATPAPAGRAALQRALVFLAQGRQAEALALAGPLATPAAPPAVRRSATWIQARVAARAGRTDEAVRAYAAVASLPGGFAGLPEARWPDLADEAAYLAAWLWYDAGDLPRAIRALERFARAHPASRRADDARWFAAWATHRRGDQAGARRALARLDRGTLADAALYWQARLAPGPAAAAALYRRAAQAGGDGWYGALARARLAALPPPAAGEPAHAGGAPPPPGPSARRDPAVQPGPADPPLPPLTLPAGAPGLRLRAAGALLALGWRDAARAELADLLRQRAAGAAGPLAELGAFAGEVDLPFRAARDQLGRTRRTARWLYPDPLRALAPLAAAAGVDADLLRAVVRKESAFRPDARSAAGAVGLLQLVPATASRLAALAGVADGAAPDLLDPGTNVALGAHYLALLVDRFGGEPAALAAYNAGPGPAAAWARAGAGAPIDEWVEAIPYKETRGYVKAVLAAREAYRALGGRPPALDPAAPVAAPATGVGF